MSARTRRRGTWSAPVMLQADRRPGRIAFAVRDASSPAGYAAERILSEDSAQPLRSPFTSSSQSHRARRAQSSLQAADSPVLATAHAPEATARCCDTKPPPARQSAAGARHRPMRTPHSPACEER